MNMQGQILFEKTSATTSEKLQTSSLSGGIYLVNVKGTNCILTKRLVIAR
jgi:hypothetical protein